MKRKWLLKTVLTAALSAGLAATAVTGMAAEEATTEVAAEAETEAADAAESGEEDTELPTEGYYEGRYSGASGGTTFEQDCFISFHEKGEIIEDKQTFYFQAMSGSGEQWIAVIDPLLGVYEVLDEEITMNTAPLAEQRGEENWEEMTADKTIVFYSLDGETEYFRSGWDTEENKILGIPTENEIGATSWYTNYCFLHLDEESQERGVELYTFYYRLEDGRNASITIYHDGTYLDNMLTGTGEVTGTWELDGDTYILTAGEGATGGTLVIDKDDATKAVFTPEGGSAMELGPRVRNEVYVFADETGENVVILYDDMSCSIVISGAQCEGTWEKNADGTPRSVTIADMNETAYITGSGESFEVTLDGVLMSTDNEASASALAKADSEGENEEGAEEGDTGRKPSTGVTVAASGSTSYVYYGKIAGYFEAIIELLPGGTATFKCDMHGH